MPWWKVSLSLKSCGTSNDSAAEERQTREEFNAAHGEHLPTDVYPSMQNPPTRYEILPWHQDTEETLPCIDRDLLTEVCHVIVLCDVLYE